MLSYESTLRDLEHDYSSTQVNLTGDLRAMVLAFMDQIPVEQFIEDGREDNPHITVKYGLHTQNARDVVEVLNFYGTIPITYMLGEVSVFELPDADVVKIEVRSSELHRLNAQLKQSLEHTDTYPTYEPHVTIGYLKPGEGKRYVGDQTFVGLLGTARELVFSTKDDEVSYIPLGAQERAAGGPGSGNFGHAGRPGEVGGSSSRSEAQEALVAKLGVSTTTDPGGTGFILPDGTRVPHGGYHHAIAAGGRDKLEQLLKEGVIRHVPEGVEVWKTPTQAQAEILADAWNSSIAQEDRDVFYLDVGAPGDKLLGHKMFEGEIEASAIQDFVRGVIQRKGRWSGGKGSGNFGHEGRPGEVGGSAPSGFDSVDPVGFAPGQKFNVNDVDNRRLLFHPNGTLVFGEEAEAGDERTHGEALDAVLKTQPDLPQKYDSYTIRGQIGYNARVDRRGAYLYPNSWDALGSGPMNPKREPQFIDDAAKLAERLVFNGAGPDFVFSSKSELVNGRLGNLYPSLFRKGRKLAAHFYADTLVSEFVADLARGAALLADPSLDAEFIAAQFGKPEAEVLIALGERSFLQLLGGKGSGNFGHSGRPGEVGGSAPQAVPFDKDAYNDERFQAIIGDLRAPTSWDVKRVKSDMKRRGQLNPDGTASFYHVTLADNVDSVLKHGLVPAFNEAPGQTWEADHSKYATYFHQARDVAMDQGNPEGHEPGMFAVIEARIPITELTLVRFVPDEDWAGVQEGIQTLRDGGAVAFIGGVPPEAVRVVSREEYARRGLGGKGSGNFGHAGRPGEVGGSAESKAPEGITLTKSFNLQLEDFDSNRRFLYNPRTSTIVLGERRDKDHFSKTGHYSSHAEEFSTAQEDFDAPGKYDDQIKGWMFGPSDTYPEGLVEFYYTRAERLPGGAKFGHEREDYNEEDVLLDAYFKAAEFFIKNGATKDTKVEGLTAVFQGIAFPNHTTFGHAFPELFGKKRRAAAAPHWQLLHRAADAQVPSLEKAIRRAFRAGQAEISIGQIEKALRKMGLRTAGGPGSGNFGHAGRPGEVGGSAPSDELASAVAYYTSQMGGAQHVGELSANLLKSSVPVDPQRKDESDRDYLKRTKSYTDRELDLMEKDARQWREMMMARYKVTTDEALNEQLALAAQKRAEAAAKSPHTQANKEREETLTKNVTALVEAVRHAPEAEMPLFRAVGVPTDSGVRERFDALKPGDPVSFDRLTSFSSSQKQASQFAITEESITSGVADPDDMMHPSDAASYSNYEFRIEGPHKSLDVSPLSRYKKEQERLTHGVFEVLRVEENTDAPALKEDQRVRYRRTIILRHKSTY